jgi:hypothetical protein
MDARQKNSFTKAVQYSLVLTLELDFNAKEEKLFNECTDSIVQTDPKRYCLQDIQGTTKFGLWTQQEIDSMCAAAAT